MWFSMASSTSLGAPLSWRTARRMTSRKTANPSTVIARRLSGRLVRSAWAAFDRPSLRRPGVLPIVLLTARHQAREERLDALAKRHCAVAHFLDHDVADACRRLFATLADLARARLAVPGGGVHLRFISGRREASRKGSLEHHQDGGESQGDPER